MYFSLYRSSEGKRGFIQHQPGAGFTLIESLVAVAIFVMVAVGIYQSYTKMMGLVRASRIKVAATALANEQFEIIRNLPYADVGLVAGIPVGKVPPLQTLARSGQSFAVTTVIRNIDDPFDGTLGGAPNDLSPADSKFVQIDIACTTCQNFTPMNFSSRVAPKNLETISSNGALFIQVFDAVGQPVQGANVHIENNQGGTPIIIDDTTNNAGLLQIVDAPPGVEAYEITVSKSGYSTDRTYTSGAPGNPNPTKPHATVVLQTVTQISFSIDRTSTLNVSSVRDTCAAVASIDFTLKGSKLIGLAPDVLKYNVAHITDGLGQKTIAALEWDTYYTTLTDGAYDLIGSIPLLPFALAPNSSQDVRFIVAPKNPNTLLVTVKDAATQLPLSGAQVTLTKTGYTNTLITGRGFLRQTDWSGGGGQNDFIDETRYHTSDGNIEVSSPVGDMTLRSLFGLYAPSGMLESSAFDTGSVSDFHQIISAPTNQPPDTGPDSVKFQVATNNDKTTWSYLGPDGTPGTYYTLTNTNISGVNNGNRYIRYRAFLSTASTTWTPNVSDVSLTFTSSCVPPGQVSFTGLGAGTYDLTVSKAGYTTFNDPDVIVGAPWQEKEVSLGP